MSMASSNNSNSIIKKTKNNRESSSTPASKAKTKKEDSKKTNNNNNQKNKKKLQFRNGNSKQLPKGKKQKRREEEDVEEAKPHVFPMNRIRTMLKGEIPDIRVSSEALLAINKATEKFIDQFTQDAYVCAVQDRKKFLSYNHLSNVVSKKRRYDFLSDFVPEKVKAEDALRESKPRGNRGG